MRKRKGAALPGAVILCTFLLIVSFTVSYIVIETISLSQYQKIVQSHNLIYQTAHNEFVKNNGALPTDTTFNWEVYEKEEDTNVKALAAYHKASDELEFYSIYDFEHDELLAYQTSSFYITTTTVGEQTTKYLGGIVKVTRA